MENGENLGKRLRRQLMSLDCLCRRNDDGWFKFRIEGLRSEAKPRLVVIRIGFSHLRGCSERSCNQSLWYVLNPMSPGWNSVVAHLRREFGTSAA